MCKVAGLTATQQVHELLQPFLGHCIYAGTHHSVQLLRVIGQRSADRDVNIVAMVELCHLEQRRVKTLPYTPQRSSLLCYMRSNVTNSIPCLANMIC